MCCAFEANEFMQSKWLDMKESLFFHLEPLFNYEPTSLPYRDKVP